VAVLATRYELNRWHDFGMVGVRVRIHDMTGDDLGIADVPTRLKPEISSSWSVGSTAFGT
jgi:hypothetical protein